MRKVAKLGIILLAGLIMFVIAYSFAFKGLSDRVIMLGLGIDLLTETGEYEVTRRGDCARGGQLSGGRHGRLRFAACKRKGRNRVSRGRRYLSALRKNARPLGECSILVIGEEAAKKFGFAATARLFFTPATPSRTAP